MEQVEAYLKKAKAAHRANTKPGINDPIPEYVGFELGRQGQVKENKNFIGQFIDDRRRHPNIIKRTMALELDKIEKEMKRSAM